ncbi:hypothetical protein ATSB10_11510 [Dyella thiooxydans]|uniref:Uncharacterized protein n=1 Tax=Dyella thiooxydans TaxID=445710 RepID=A0A161JCZ1_9GAMM|nr:hypothetical protein ATSB10_11510 [Dyella thiooxydans]
MDAEGEQKAREGYASRFVESTARGRFLPCPGAWKTAAGLRCTAIENVFTATHPRRRSSPGNTPSFVLEMIRRGTVSKHG